MNDAAIRSESIAAPPADSELDGMTGQPAERAAAKFRFLAGASALLASSLDYQQTLRTVARLAVPEFADWAAVDIIDEAGAPRRLAVEHADPRRVQLALQLAERYPADPAAALGLPAVLRTGRPELVEDIADALLDAAARDPEHRRLLAALGLRSYAIAPLLIDGAAIGALTFAQAESQRRFTPDDLPFLEDLAHRAALAIHHARLVTELAEARAQLAAQAAALEMQAAELARANEAKRQFLASMSHELRTPLNAIAGYSEVLELGIPGALNAQQTEIVARIRRNERRLLVLINDILNFTKLSTGKLEVALARVPLAPLVADLELLIAPQVQQRNITLERHPPPPDLAALANAERVEQILLNLLSNAVKFTPAGGRIELSCSRDHGRVRTHVRDTGRGIPAAKLGAIFEPFVQIDPEPARENAGVGLGLAISRELARAMGGDIKVESEPGSGSCFTLSLRASRADDRPRRAEVP